MHNNKYGGASVISENSYVDTECGKECEARVVNADTLPAAENYPWFGGDFKIPKVLTEFVVQIDSESLIRLNEPTYEIKRIEKQVFLKQCRFIPCTEKVFLEGYIRKNIEYATRSCTRGAAIAGSIKDTTVHIPFRVYTKVDFHGNKPIILPNPPAMVARYFDEKRMGKNIREADRSNIEILNEPVFCELEWTAVLDADIDNKGIPVDGLMNEEEFQEFTDKSVVYICIKLLQKQQVCMPDMKPPHHMKEEYPQEVASPMDTQWNFPTTDLLHKMPEKPGR